MNNLPNSIVKTQDGSNTLLSGRFGETYHSKYGAIQESMHVFINAGLDFFVKTSKNESLSILEYGFGTGLNALLSLEYALQAKSISIDYHALEAYPVDEKDISSIGYCDLIKSKNLESHFFKMHKAWDSKQYITNSFTLSKHLIQFENFKSEQHFDLIYFDAFAPSTQAHLWEVEFLSKVYELTKENGILVSYCAKGSFKRALKSCGYQIESIAGPPGKREMTRAKKKIE